MRFNEDHRIQEMFRVYKEDPENSFYAQALEAALRRAGREAEADKIVIPTAIADGRNAREYVLGSNGKKPRKARFSVTHPESQQRITFASQREQLVADREYEPETDEEDDRFWKIGAMVGSSNENYEDFGVIKLEGGFPKFYWATQSRIAKDDKTIKVFSWLWKSLSQGVLPKSVEFFNEGKCCRCGRVLTVPESRSRGVGPVCARKYIANKERPIQPTQGNTGA